MAMKILSSTTAALFVLLTASTPVTAAAFDYAGTLTKYIFVSATQHSPNSMFVRCTYQKETYYNCVLKYSERLSHTTSASKGCLYNGWTVK
jgi:hypothetical protein